MCGIKEPNMLGYNDITWASVFLLMSFMLASKLRHPSAVMCRVMPEGWIITWCKTWCIFYFKKSTMIPHGYLSGITIKHESNMSISKSEMPICSQRLIIGYKAPSVCTVAKCGVFVPECKNIRAKAKYKFCSLVQNDSYYFLFFTH